LGFVDRPADRHVQLPYMKDNYIYSPWTAGGPKWLAVGWGMAADDIDQLISELHASVGSADAAAGDTARVERWLRILAAAGGSDLLLVAGAAPSVRVDGKISPLADGPIDGVDVEDAVLPAL